MAHLTGRTALVTGGSRGIGAATVQRLADDGADVVFTYHASPDRAAKVVSGVVKRGGSARAIRADMRDPQQVRDAVAQAAADSGRLDILVNNAGVFDYGHIDDLTLDDFTNTMAVHVQAAFVGVQAALAHMPRGGRIITIGSNLALQVPSSGYSLYAMSKSALLGFTSGLARDLGPRGITATLVHPGSTATDMNPSDGEHSDAERALVPLGRYAEPAEIAATVSHLAGPAGAYINGTGIVVDGGVNA